MSGSDLYMNAEQAARKWSFEIPPEPVGADLIAETIVADVIVVGEGFSGLCTALSSAEAGLDTIIVTASGGPVGRGGSVFAAYSKVMQRLGYPKQEVEDFYLQEFASSSFCVDQRKWYSFYNNSEEAMDWLIDMLEADGVRVVLENANDDDPHSPTFQPPGTHAFLGENISFAGVGIRLALKTLEKNFTQRGGRVIYRNIAKQLVRDGGGGRVTAVIAMDADGRYIKYSARKAIVLATGDFSANREMMTKYCPAYAGYFSDKEVNYDAGFVVKGIFRGDGQRMALWAGAAWQRTFPNAPMIQGSSLCDNLPYGAHRGLCINRDGQRFMNEDCNAAYSALAILREPGQTAYAIWGTNYAYDTDWHIFGATRGSATASPGDIIAAWDKQAHDGRIVKCDSVDDVIEKLGLPRKAAAEAVGRYNSMCREESDSDFHKKAKYLQEIKEAPFYGGAMSDTYAFTVLGGPRTNQYMQICGEDDVPLPGLYAAGTMIGDMYANCYNFRIAGHNYGCCLTFGYLTGKYIAEHE